MTSNPHIARRRTFLAACLLVWVGALVATHIPPDRLPQTGISDKFLHALCYFVLAGTFWLTLRAYRVESLKRLTCVFFATLAYAAIDEITQPMVDRHASLDDWLADAAGAAIALFVLELLVRVRTKRS